MVGSGSGVCRHRACRNALLDDWFVVEAGEFAHDGEIHEAPFRHSLDDPENGWSGPRGERIPG